MAVSAYHSEPRGGTWPLEVCRVFRAGIAVEAYHAEPRGPHLAVRFVVFILGRNCTVSLSFMAAGAALGRSKYVVYSEQGWQCQPIMGRRGGAHLAARIMSCIPGRACSGSLSFGAAGTEPGRSQYGVYSGQGLQG
jgi:hypothetical protein